MGKSPHSKNPFLYDPINIDVRPDSYLIDLQEHYKMAGNFQGPLTGQRTSGLAGTLGASPIKKDI